MALAGPSSHNFTVLVAEVADDGYDTLVADIWVGVVLTLMVLSCVCCVCSCLLYHKFQQWKRSVLAARSPSGEQVDGPYGAGDLESLPSYTIVSGLPTYEEALNQLRLARERRASLKSASGGDLAAPAPAAPAASATAATATATPNAAAAVAAAAAAAAAAANNSQSVKLSVAELFQVYKSYPPM